MSTAETQLMRAADSTKSDLSSEATRQSLREVAYDIYVLRLAITLEGPAPGLHRKIMRKHRSEWPTLWAAIDRLLEIDG